MAEAVRERRLPVDDKIHTWPHLVRMEFLVALFVTVALTLWAMMVDAPLEEPSLALVYGTRLCGKGRNQTIGLLDREPEHRPGGMTPSRDV